MPASSSPADHSQVLTLGELILDRRGGRTYRQLEADSDGVVKSQRWEHMANNVRVDGFPRPQTIEAIAKVLDVDVQAVILSTAKTLGLPVRRQPSLLATLLPPDTDNLTLEQRNAVIMVIQAMRSAATQDEPIRMVIQILAADGKTPVGPPRAVTRSQFERDVPFGTKFDLLWPVQESADKPENGAEEVAAAAARAAERMRLKEAEHGGNEGA